MSTPRTESAPWSAPADDGGDPITAGLERVQSAIDSHSGVPDTDQPTDPLGPPRVVLQPGDLLAPSPTSPREIADVIADVARRVLAQSEGSAPDAVAREIGNNAAQVLATADPIERVIAAVRAIGQATYASVHMTKAGEVLVSMNCASDDDVVLLAAKLGLDEPELQANKADQWLRADRNGWAGPVRVSVTGPMHPIATTSEQPATSERAA